MNKTKDLISSLIKKVYLRKDQIHLRISYNLAKEIRLTQKMMVQKQNGRKKPINKLRASDYIAEISRRERLKLK